MGTRNLTMVQHEGEYKIAQYGQWDATILKFIKARARRAQLVKSYSLDDLPSVKTFVSELEGQS